MKKAILTSFIACICGILSAQNTMSEKLKNELDNHLQDDTLKVKLLYDYASSLPENQHSKGITTMKEGMNLARKLKWINGEALGLINLTYIYIRDVSFKEAVETGLTAIKLCEETNNDVLLIDAQLQISELYRGTRDFKNALYHGEKALMLAENLKDERRILRANSFLAVCYSDMQNWVLAEKYLEPALQLSIKRNYTQGIITALDLRANKENYLKNYPNEKTHYLRILDLLKNTNSSIQSSFFKSKLGVTYALLNQKDSALYYAEWALKEAKEHKLKKETIDGHHALYDIYLTFKDYEKALLNYSTFIQLMQEDFNMQSAADMANSRAKFEEAKKEVIAAKEVQRQKFIRNTSLLGLVVVCVFAVIFFRQRNNINKQKKRSDELLYNILPEEVAAELKKNGSAEAKQFDEVTVLFTDFKDFTQLSEQMTAKELVEEIHTCFMAFDNIMEKYGIEKIKTIGDSYMCAGGLPLANKTHAADVVNAGLEIQKFILNRVVERTALGKEPFQIRIGIHTGPVVAGIVGIKKFAYDIWGDTVNTASRMESSGEAGKINISETTYELVKDIFSFTHRGKIQAKNKGELGMIFVRKNLRRAHPITRCSPHGYFSAWESSFFKVLLFYVKVYRLRSRHVSYTQPFAENK